MDWSRTKTIFIFTFLLLNIFLGYQLNEKLNEADVGIEARPELQERLEANNIQVNFDGADETVEGAPITGSLSRFNEEELEENLEGQDFTLLNESRLYSEMETPRQLVSANLRATVEAFLLQYVTNGEEYEIAYYDEEEGTVGLYQTYDGRKIDQYERDDFHLVLNLTEDLEVESYEQIYLSVTEQVERRQELLTPYDAIELLLDSQTRTVPVPNAVIDNAELGYYSLFEPDDGFQVFTPVWRLTVNDDYFFVDALTGDII